MNLSPAITDATYNQFAQAVQKPHLIDESNDDQALREAAQHFESLFINMWLKSARDANRVISADNPMRSPELEMHEEMRDQEVAVHLAQEGGIGLADVIVQQLKGRYPLAPPSHSTSSAAIQTSDSSSAAPTSSIGKVDDAPAGLGQRRVAFNDAQAFVENILPVVKGAIEDQSLPVLGVLSQAALETGWGRQVISDARGNLSHNLFGMKSQSLSEPHVKVASREFGEQGWFSEASRFRAYPDWQSSVQDYVAKLKNSTRYADVMNAGSDIAQFADSLAKAGYATDPDYANKIIGIYARIKEMVGG